MFQVRSAGVSGPLCHAIRDLISTAFSGSAGGEEREKKKTLKGDWNNWKMKKGKQSWTTPVMRKKEEIE